MKKILFTIAAGFFLLASCGNKTETIALESKEDTLSWAMGCSLAETVQSGFFNFDEDIVRAAFESTLKGEGKRLDEESYRNACQMIAFLSSRYQSKTGDKDAQKRQEDFFSQLVAQHPNLQKAPEGYYYEVVREGHGPKAKLGKCIKLDFTATNLYNGEVFEKTIGNREPIVHVLGNPMFQGMQYAIQLMNAGSIYRFYFPYELVGNARGVPAQTPLCYEVELHEIYND